MMTRKNIEIVKELYHCFNERNDKNIERLLSDDIHWNQMDGFPGAGKFIGIAEVFHSVFGGLRSEWVDWQSSADVFFESGETVFVKGHYSGIHKVSKKVFKAPFIGEYIIEGGRIREFNQYTDTFLIRQATIIG